MPFDAILGQSAAIATITRALERRRVHHAYRFEGPEGVGKELAAMAFAQALVCTDAGAEEAGAPGGSSGAADTRFGCGSCGACRRAVTMTATEPVVPLHPDVVLVGRGVYPPELIGGKKEASEISVEQIRRVVLSRTGYGPHEGRAQVFVIRAADELSVGAANALLKTLEEPPANTYFVLLTAVAEALLDTIRSRTLPIRFAPLSDDVLTRILRKNGVDEARIEAAIAGADGSARAALDATDPELTGQREAFVTGLFECLHAPDLGAAVRFAEAVGAERASVAVGLRAVAVTFANFARQDVVKSPSDAERGAVSYGLVLDALDALERNGAGALTLMNLIASLRAGRQARPGSPPRIVVTRR
ncbi:MAG: DNA polymerase III subunit delta' [Myxococcales bacterium]|nr:DNA polymerase III subunit delta' [Myxococcales bacterium]